MRRLAGQYPQNWKRYGRDRLRLAQKSHCPSKIIKQNKRNKIYFLRVFDDSRAVWWDGHLYFCPFLLQILVKINRGSQKREKVEHIFYSTKLSFLCFSSLFRWFLFWKCPSKLNFVFILLWFVSLFQIMACVFCLDCVDEVNVYDPPWMTTR